MLAVTQLVGFGAGGDGGNDQYTKVLLHFDGADAGTTITDDNFGGSAHTWTANGNAQLDNGVTPKFGTTALLCDGTGDYVTTTDSADFTLGSGDFTIDFWFNVATAGNGTRRLPVGQTNNAGTAGAWNTEFTTGNIAKAAVYKASAQTAVTGTTAFTTTGWHHFAFVRTGNVLKLFLDGIQEGGDVAFTGSVDDSGNAFSVGRCGELTTLNWNGSIDEFRLSVGIARWTANFSPPVDQYLT